jgi:hypothetical protein
MSEIARFSSQVVITAASSAATTTPRVAFGRYGGGAMIVANTNGATQVRWYGAANAQDAPVQVYADGSALTTAVTVGVIPFPDSCYALPFVAPIIVGATTMAATVVFKG